MRLEVEHLLLQLHPSLGNKVGRAVPIIVRDIIWGAVGIIIIIIIVAKCLRDTMIDNSGRERGVGVVGAGGRCINFKGGGKVMLPFMSLSETCL